MEQVNIGELSDEIKEEWLLWRLVMAQPQVATLTELETGWTYTDMIKANNLMDMREDIESYLNTVEEK